MAVTTIRRHDPKSHRHTCPAITGRGRVCGRGVKHHVDAGLAGCGNYCGIHARAMYRSAWGTVILDAPIVAGRRQPR